MENSSLTIIDTDVGLDAAGGGGGGGDGDDLRGRGGQDAHGGGLEHVSLLLADRGQHGGSHRHRGTHVSICSQSTSTFTFSPPLVFDMSRSAAHFFPVRRPFGD